MGVVFIVMVSVVAIVAMGIFSDAYKMHIKAREKETTELSSGLLNRINRIEERIANLETIIIKSEREKEFKNLEKED
ncbi:MAG TPA: hypothetical protein VHP36_07955 [Chitinispirillaceae bacterium]|nr:hypothetical protein [Chitinispirillaceae bacterium]